MSDDMYGLRRRADRLELEFEMGKHTGENEMKVLKEIRNIRSQIRDLQKEGVEEANRRAGGDKEPLSPETPKVDAIRDFKKKGVMSNDIHKLRSRARYLERELEMGKYTGQNETKALNEIRTTRSQVRDMEKIKQEERIAWEAGREDRAKKEEQEKIEWEAGREDRAKEEEQKKIEWEAGRPMRELNKHRRHLRDLQQKLESSKNPVSPEKERGAIEEIKITNAEIIYMEEFNVILEVASAKINRKLALSKPMPGVKYRSASGGQRALEDFSIKYYQPRSPKGHKRLKDW